MPLKSRLVPHATSSRVVENISSLDPESFASFGEVIQNPTTHSGSPQAVKMVKANQGTATKWVDITHMRNWYHLAPTKKLARTVVNMFVCDPRKLRQTDDGIRVFDVNVLERHPFTPQTFIPMALDRENRDTRYLVIVAPTKHDKTRDYKGKSGFAENPQYSSDSRRNKWLGALPTPFVDSYKHAPRSSQMHSLGDERGPKGKGEPDLENIQAFIGRGDQAVTYGAGTWHAPMVVLGEKSVEFVVVQYANGVVEEDCQEFGIPAGQIGIHVDSDVFLLDRPAVLRAKL